MRKQGQAKKLKNRRSKWCNSKDNKILQNQVQT